MKRNSWVRIAGVLLLFVVGRQANSQSPSAKTPVFEKQVVNARFVSEGVAVGDVNKDGKMDVLAGNYWFEAPGWKAHLIHADTLNPIPGYSTSFLNFSLDVNNDGWVDLIQFDQPGANCVWYENPKGKGGLWKGHLILKTAGIESPAMVDVDGDGRNDIICNDVSARQVVWLKSPVGKGDTLWQKKVISFDEKRATHQYTHGLGWGDINGDGRKDVIIRTGWWEAPVDVKQEGWKFHEANLGADCANMYVWDVDGDGDADVMSSSAHNYGIWWHEQKGNEWVTHEISKLFSQTHALVMKDMNNDGTPDLVTGKRFGAHIKGDPGGEEASVLYWFQLVPGKTPNWIAHKVDDNSGVGNNFAVEDMNGDRLPDIIVSNKNGVYVFLQKK